MKDNSFFNVAQMIRRVLGSMDLWREKPSGKPPPENQAADDSTYPPFEDDWDGYEELSVALNW